MHEQRTEFNSGRNLGGQHLYPCGQKQRVKDLAQSVILPINFHSQLVYNDP